MKYITKYLVILYVFISFSCYTYSQSKQNFARYKNTVYTSYGGVLCGGGDILGQKIYLGTQYLFYPRLGAELYIAGSLIDHTFYFNNNPEWARHEVSNGVELSTDLIYRVDKNRFRFTPFFGPTIRYGVEQHSRDYGIYYDRTTGVYEWYCEYDEELGYKLGFNFGFNTEFRVYNRIYLGPKFAVSYFPKSQYIFSYLGLTIYRNYFR